MKLLSAPSEQVTRWDGGLEMRMGVEGEAYGVSADGSTVVGTALFDQYFEAFSWSDGVFTPLGVFDENAVNPSARALDATADGSIIVGFSNARVGGSDENLAFIWDAENGMRSLEDVLTNEYGLDLTGWTLREARGISDDGLTIIGIGHNPDGNPEGWIAIIPEPSTALLLGFGLMALAAGRRR